MEREDLRRRDQVLPHDGRSRWRPGDGNYGETREITTDPDSCDVFKASLLRQGCCSTSKSAAVDAVYDRARFQILDIARGHRPRLQTKLQTSTMSNSTESCVVPDAKHAKLHSELIS